LQKNVRISNVFRILGVRKHGEIRRRQGCRGFRMFLGFWECESTKKSVGVKDSILLILKSYHYDIKSLDGRIYGKINISWRSSSARRKGTF